MASSFLSDHLFQSSVRALMLQKGRLAGLPRSGDQYGRRLPDGIRKHLFQLSLVHTALTKLNLYFSFVTTCFSRPVKLDRRGTCRGACIDKFTSIEDAVHCDLLM
jgi:hypothetical protein